MDRPLPAIRQCRLRLQPATIARLMSWQTQAVEAGYKPSYSELIDALVARSAEIHVGHLVEQPLPRAS